MASRDDAVDRVRTALSFIDQCLESPERQAELERLQTFEEVRRYAADEGFELEHTAFAEAMKIAVDQSLERSGIPEWIRHRVHAPVHD
ncbi:hypothetical protein HTZ77_21260 [Nonomuraea sp. SMC257]|uniref:Nif11 family protein n=1 Tax=Nonomuraea montanisoli TaxID=2741721 RepID=A0A7Y6I9C8_9ACTN|nr:hypothetical protein [Nonomuraea montanisoli]NUW33941.1 hypothetical protein [Nonomuraea montanisoli]